MATEMTYTRTGQKVVDSKGASGKRGKLSVARRTWFTIERADGYKWLRPGTYECEMGYWTSSSGSTAKSIRVLGNYSNGRIYVHPANWPYQLSGCIAPGTTKLPDGVGNSRNALQAILKALGGFKKGQKVTLKVV